MLFAAYFSLPEHLLASRNRILRLVIVVTVAASLVTWEIKRISWGRAPQLRAIEALGSLIPLFIVVFSAMHLARWASNPQAFSGRLNLVRSLYFTVTIFSTFGIGDITPTTDPIRVAMSIQMLLDLILIGSAIRLLLRRAETALDTFSQDQTPQEGNGKSPATGETGDRLND